MQKIYRLKSILLAFVTFLYILTASATTPSKNLHLHKLTDNQKWLTSFTLSPDETELYGLIDLDIYIVDIASGAIKKKISLPNSKTGQPSAYQLVFTKDGKKAYISDYDENIYVLDTRKQELVGKIKNIDGLAPVLCISPRGELIAVDNDPALIHLIDPNTDNEIIKIKPKRRHGWSHPTIALSNTNNSIYIAALMDLTASNGNSTISIFNLHNHQYEDKAFIFNNQQLTALATNPLNQNIMYAVFPHKLYILNLSKNEIIGKIPLELTNSLLLAITVTHDGSKIYIGGDGENALTVISIKDNRVIKKIPVGKSPQTLQLSADGRTLYVGNANDASFSLIDIANDIVTRNINIESRP